MAWKPIGRLHFKQPIRVDQASYAWLAIGNQVSNVAISGKGLSFKMYYCFCSIEFLTRLAVPDSITGRKATQASLLSIW